MQTFGRDTCCFRQAIKGYGGVDVVTQHCLAGVEFTGEEIIDSLAEHGGTKAGITLRTRPDSFTKFASNRHEDHLFLRFL